MRTFDEAMTTVVLRYAFLFTLLASCSKPSDNKEISDKKETVRRCSPTGECPSGFTCKGPGCDPTEITCIPISPCTQDVTPFCGCDGKTYYGSSSCTGLYRHRGACP